MNNIITRRKSFLVTGIFLALLVIGLGAYVYLTSPSNLISLDVNPSIEIHTNRLNHVVSINPINDDAKQLMAGYELADRNLESVIKDIVDRMILGGYISSGLENKILVTVDDSNASSNLLESINNTINTYMQEKQVSTDVLKQNLSISVAETQTAHENEVSAGKMAIINRLLENKSSLTTEELAHSSIKTLMQLASDNNIDMEDLIQNYSLVSEDERGLEAGKDGDIASFGITTSEDTKSVDVVSQATIDVNNVQNVKETIVKEETNKVEANKVDAKNVDAVSQATIAVNTNQDVNEEGTTSQNNIQKDDNDNEDAFDSDKEDSQYEDANDNEDGDEDSQYEDAADNEDGDEDSQVSEDFQNSEDYQGDEDNQNYEGSRDYRE